MKIIILIFAILTLNTQCDNDNCVSEHYYSDEGCINEVYQNGIKINEICRLCTSRTVYSTYYKATQIKCKIK